MVMRAAGGAYCNHEPGNIILRVHSRSSMSHVPHFCHVMCNGGDFHGGK
jgi:hypothetical protein